MPAEYVYEDVVGLIESVEWKKTKTGRDFAETVLDGRTFTIWEAQLGQYAETIQQAGEPVQAKIRAKVDGGKVSQYWAIAALEMIAPEVTNENQSVTLSPLPLPGVTKEAGIAPKGLLPVVMGPSRVETYLRKLDCLKLTIEALRGKDELADPAAVCAYAAGLQQHLGIE